MGIKYLEDKRIYQVSYSKRHQVTRKPVGKTRTHFTGSSGERKPITTMTQAKRVRDSLILEVEKQLKAQITPTWEKTLDDFEPYFLNTGVEAKTVETYLLCLRKHTAEWSSLLLDEISSVMIRDLVSSSKRSQSHQKNLLKFIRRVFKFAIEAGYQSSNPTPVIKFRVSHKNANVLKEVEITKLLTLAKRYNSEWFYHWLLALYTGLRNGELYALKWKQIDFELRQIKVQESWNSKDGFKSTKSGDERIVPISKSIIGTLKELRLSDDNSEFVLPRLHKWDKGEQARELRKFLVSIGLHEIRFHDLRATWATQLLSNNVEPVKVMAMGGWKDMKTMMVYIRKAGVDLNGATDCLNHGHNLMNATKVLNFSK